MYRLLLVAASCLAASHPELRGEHPDHADIDDGQCVPMKCELDVPPRQCTQLCAQRHYVPVCQPPGQFCLCQRLTGGGVELVSPDEVLDQPQDYGPLNFFALIVPLGTFFRENGPDATATPEPEVVVVNVHEGRLFWLFRYVLSGLFLLMVALVVYELVLCRTHKFEVDEPVKWKTLNSA